MGEKNGPESPKPAAPVAAARPQPAAPPTADAPAEKPTMRTHVPRAFILYGVAGLGLALIITLAVANFVDMRLLRAQEARVTSLQSSLGAMQTTLREISAATTKPPTEDSPQDYADHLARGNFHFTNGEYRAAANELEMAVRACPSFKIGDEAYFRRAACSLKLGDGERAKRCLRVVTDQFPGSPSHGPALYELAQLLIKEGRYAQARRLLYRLLALRDGLPPEAQPYVASAQYAIAACYEGEAETLVAAGGRGQGKEE